MAITLDDTPKGASANTFVSRATATTYLEDYRLHTSEWTSASNEDKDTALAWATATLDASMDWFGAKRTLEQALRWPRSGIVDLDGDNIDYDTIPTLLENATAELAFELVKRDRLKEPSMLGKGISKVKLDVIAVEADMGQRQNPVPDHIVRMLAPLGSLYPNSNYGDRIVPVVRG